MVNPGSFTFMAVDDIQAAWKKIMETGAPLDDAPKHGFLRSLGKIGGNER